MSDFAMGGPVPTPSKVLVVTCPRCGQVEVPPYTVSLAICQNARKLSSWAFTCIGCGDLIQKDGPTEQTVDTLLGAGVLPRSFTLPLELLEKHTGPVIHVDDLTESPFDWDALLGGAA